MYRTAADVPRSAGAIDGANDTLWMGSFATPWGAARACGRGKLLVEVTLPPAGGRQVSGPPSAVRSPGGQEASGYGERWIERLEDYLRGGVGSWTAADLDWSALRSSDFRREVYCALMKVPRGKVVGYADLAERAGHPGAARAVGTAMAANPMPLVIPCHRVVRSDGHLGEYGAGREWKRFLLDLEGVI